MADSNTHHKNFKYVGSQLKFERDNHVSSGTDSNVAQAPGGSLEDIQGIPLNTDHKEASINGDAPADGTSDTPASNRQELIYNVSDSPPFYMSVFFGLQQALLSLSACLSVSLLVAETVCAENDEEFKARLIGTGLFMNGVTTLLMTFVGIRLPLFQGGHTDYLIPLLAMAAVDRGRCEIDEKTINASVGVNGTVYLSALKRDIILQNTQMLQGALILAGAIHTLVGLTGLVGLLLRFVGPVTIVPAIFLIGVYLMKATARFARVHWGISSMTCALSLILALYMSKIKLPFPSWSRKKGCHVTRYPYHQMFALLIAILVGWGVCGIMTAAGAFPNEKNATSYLSRTDARIEVLHTANWFYFPYPGQFGPISFSVSVFVGFMMATITSILDSVGDYYACAAMCRCPPPPSHAVNRGVAMEGLCTTIAGLVGCGHATTTYGGNIGAIGVTRVASRQIFFVCGLIYVVFGLVGKISAVFICIPYPVLGGAMITLFGMFIGVVLSNLHAIDLTSVRNVAIIGTSILTGLMVPYWIEEYPNELSTGYEDADKVLRILLGNPNMFGGVLACILDNTVPGTIEERGIATWQKVADSKDSKTVYAEGYDVYNLPFPKRFMQSKVFKYIPFLPNPDEGPIPPSLASELISLKEN